MMWIQAKLMVKVGDLVECNNGLHYYITKKRFNSCDMRLAGGEQFQYTHVAYEHIKGKVNAK